MSFDFRGSSAKREDPVVPAEGSLAEDAAEEMSELESAYVKRRKDEDKRKRAAVDSEYWFAVCFRTREDKERFLGAAGARKGIHGDKYLDGYALAKLLGVDME